MTLLFLVFYLPGYLWPRQDLLASADSLRPYMLQFLLVALPQILLLLYVLKLRADTDGSQFCVFGIRPPRASDLLRGLLIFAGIFLLLAALVLILSLLPAGARSLFVQGFRWQLRDPRLIPLVLLFCLATGYREELFFRSYLITRFSQLQLPVAACIAMSTLLFSAGHLYQGLAGLSVALIQGTYFSILFVRTKNLHPLALAHGMYNAAVLTITLFVDAEALTGP